MRNRVLNLSIMLLFSILSYAETTFCTPRHSAEMLILTEMGTNEGTLSNLLPKPQSVKAGNGTFTGKVNEATVTINANLGTFNHNVTDFPDEGYKLSINSDGITIEAASQTGVIRAKQTLRQLAEGETETDWETQSFSYPCCEITDYPAFKVRGFMHDVGRSYVSVEELKKEIDLLSRFKVNVFFWHLTDHHAFRFESKKYPKVNTNFTTGRWENDFYKQAECTEIEAYAAERGMIVIPEIDMPGHSSSFTRAMGYTMASAQGKAALKEILKELVEAFPNAPYIHIGGDETAEATLAYINEMADHVRSLGKKVVVWNQYGAGAGRASIDPTTMHCDMSTNWATSGRLSKGIPNIDMRYNYINHFDVFADLAGIYRSNIFGVTRGTDDVAGSISGIWNDRLVGSEKQILAQNNFYANAIATAERCWIGGGKQYIEQGGAYLPNEGNEYDEYADWERRFLAYKATWMKDEPIPYVKQTNIRWIITPSYNNEGNKDKAFPIEEQDELKPELGCVVATGAGIWLNHIWAGTIAGIFGKSAQATNQTRYAWTYVYSPVAQTVGAQIEFYNYSRSDTGGAPANGKWDNMGSCVWVNDTELRPAANWTTKGSGEESELGNVNFPARKPIKVNLKEGWNKVLLKLPFVNAGNRRSKWQYTFVLTDLEGKDAVEGLIYSPNKSMTGEGDLETITTPSADKVYILKCNRGGRYVTSQGAGSNVLGATSESDEAYWRFKQRTDKKYDIVNWKDGSFISAVGIASGSAMKTIASSPSAGWEIKPSAEKGWFIIAGGSNQFNQQNQSPYAVLNWGGGNNGSDQGCQYQISEAPVTGDYKAPDIIEGEQTIKINMTTGTFTAFSGNWASKWQSTQTTSQITLNSATHNNMSVQNSNATTIQAFRGSATAPYTLSVSKDYVITGYSFDFTLVSTAATITDVNGKSYVGSTTPQHVSVTNLRQTSLNAFTFTTTTNNGINITNFQVTVEPANPTLIEQTNANNTNSNQAFDLNGRRINRNSRGIIIKGGKKVIKKINS